MKNYILRPTNWAALAYLLFALAIDTSAQSFRGQDFHRFRPKRSFSVPTDSFIHLSVRLQYMHPFYCASASWQITPQLGVDICYAPASSNGKSSLFAFKYKYNFLTGGTPSTVMPYVFLSNGLMFWEYIDKNDTYFPKTKTSAVVISGGFGLFLKLYPKVSINVESGYGQFKPLRDEPKGVLFYSVGAGYHIKIRRLKKPQTNETESFLEEDSQDGDSQEGEKSVPREDLEEKK